MIITNLKTVKFIYFTLNSLLRNYDTGVSLYIYNLYMCARYTVYVVPFKLNSLVYSL